MTSVYAPKKKKLQALRSKINNMSVYRQ